MKPLLGCSHPAHVLWAADQQQPGKDFLYEGSRLRKCQPRPFAWAHSFGLEKRIGDRADRHVMLPAGIRPALEMIEAQFGFEVLVVLLDGPALMRQSHELRQRGGRAVVLGRFTAFLRAVMPALAGASEMSYRRFLVFNVLGGLVWGSGVTLLGYFAGSSFATVAQSLGRTSGALLIIVVVTGTLAWHRRRRRSRRDAGGSVAGA